MTYDLIRQQLSKSVPFAQHTGVEIDNIEKGRAIAYLPFRPEGLNNVGKQHVSALFALGEAASGAAMAGALASILLDVRSVAAQATIKFLSTVKGPVRAEAVVDCDVDKLVSSVKTEGKSQFPVLVTLLGDNRTKVGEMTVDWQVSLRR
jgi:acyl-coenzyme A thioesterase PaaI-like protein